MRLLILTAGAVLSLAACKNNDQHDTTANADENLTAENIVSNDVTAIDAVTGEAANMAADVNYTEADDTLSNETANAASPVPRPKPLTSTPHRPPIERKSPSEPTSNSATNTAE